MTEIELRARLKILESEIHDVVYMMGSFIAAGMFLLLEYKSKTDPSFGGSGFWSKSILYGMFGVFFLAGFFFLIHFAYLSVAPHRALPKYIKAVERENEYLEKINRSKT